ncbi:MAG TPA: histidine phosphatase family protein [Pirellulales bacterium]|jgi:broad specificity phosphatase PhoE|nr:histidine phosphatase family protein [Pirellulales bacterium]
MTSSPSRRRIILVRHGRVADRYQGVCYGRSDVELSDEGRRQSDALAEELAALPITHLMHSGLTRTRWLAELIATRTAIAACVAPGLVEFNFGQWELRAWQDIFAEIGDTMNDLTRSPATFRPPSGETVHEMRDRVLAWYRELPDEGLIVAVAHAGTIAALRGSLAGVPATEWPGLIPSYGQWIELDETQRPLVDGDC